MKKLVIVIIVLCFAVESLAQILFVKDIEEITLRSEPQIGRNVIVMIPSGQRLEVLRTDSNWSQVRLPDGQTGWVMSRFLSAETPNKLKLDLLEAKYQKLAAELAATKDLNEKLKAENSAVKSEHENYRKQHETILVDHDQLRQDCADFMELQANYKALIVEYQQLKKEAETQNIRFYDLFKNLGLIFYLSGAGVLLIGMLIGLRFRAKQKRSAYL